MVLPEVESRTQDSRPRPRTQKKSEAKAKDSLSEDRHSRGQGQECSRPSPRTKDTSASALQKKGLHKDFSSDLHEKTFSKKFFKRSTNFNNSKNSAVLEPRTGQFSRTWDLEAKAKGLTFEAKAKAKDFKMCPRGRPRGQGRPWGLHLWVLQRFLVLHNSENYIQKSTKFYPSESWKTWGWKKFFLQK